MAHPAPSPATDPGGTDRTDARYRWHVLAVVLIGHLALGSTATILGASLGVVADELDTGETFLGWTITAPFLAVGVWSPVFGRLGDIVGHRRVFLVGLGVFAAATLVSAGAPNAGTLVALRVVAGIGGAATFAPGLAQIMANFDEDERGRAMGWFAMVATGAPAVGLITGGLIVDRIGWEVVFVLYGTIAAAGWVAAWKVLRPTEGRTDIGLDLPGAFWLSVTSLTLMLGLYAGGELGFDHPAAAGLLATSPLALVAFVRVERSATDPLVPLDYFAEPNIRGPLIGAAGLNAAYMGGLVVTPLLLQDLLGYSLSAASAMLLLRPASFSATSPVGGSLVTRIGERRCVLAGMGFMAVSMALLAASAPLDALALVLVGLMLSGVANGLAGPSLNTAVANAADPADLGVVSGLLSQASTLGIVFGLQAFLIAVGSDPDAAADFPPPYLLGLGLAVIGALAATTMRPRSVPATAPAAATT